MGIKLVKGINSHIPDCAKALVESELGKHYFPMEEQAQKTVLEFVGTDNFLVAVDEKDAFAGFLCYLPTGSFHAFPYIHLLVTARTQRNKGIGTQIMDLFESEISKVKDKAFLVVADFNPKARQFYLKRGYREIGIVPSLYRQYIDEHLMMKAFK